MFNTPVCSIDALIEAGQKAMPAWQAAGPQGRTGMCIEMLDRLNKQSFEIAHAVMMTTGQAWMMAFQAGSPHAQDRGLETVAYAWREQSFVPSQALWEKPQGKNPPMRMEKHFEVVGRGVAVVVGCGTFPTWNTYPGLFAALATGNAVIVKPHENAILPAAITVRTVRAVLSENGINPDLVTLCVPETRAATQQLVTHPAVRSVDFTGSNAFGQWLIDNCRQAQVYAELAGVNNIVIESTKRLPGHAGQHCIHTDFVFQGRCAPLRKPFWYPPMASKPNWGTRPMTTSVQIWHSAIERLSGKPEVAHALLGAIQSRETLARIDEANSGSLGKVVLASKALTNPDFPGAQVRTPVLLACDAVR
jgi:phenylacetic acid degradation protein paaN